MSNLTQFYYPETLEEALEILRDSQVKTGIIAGGSSVSLSREAAPEALVDITRLNLSYIESDSDKVYIGATVPVAHLYKPGNDILEFAGGVVSKAALLIASRPLRNVITVGGNITLLKIWSDLPVVFLALDAMIKIQGTCERCMSAEEFFKGHPVKHLARGELVTEVIIPRPPENSASEYIKFSKTVGDYAIATVACHLEMNGEVCSKARIVVGAVSPTPQRCREAEKVLEGQKLTPELIDKAASVCRGTVATISNVWGSSEYKTEVVENLTRRALSNCREKLQ